MREAPRLGAKVRALRRREALSQVQLAERLGISPSYLNLIESNRRPLPAPLLIKLAQLFGVDLHTFGADEDARARQRPARGLRRSALRRVPAHLRPTCATWRSTTPASRAPCSRSTARIKAQREAQRGARVAPRRRGGCRPRPVAACPSEEVNDLIQKHMNYFPELEDGAEELWKKARLDAEELYPGLVRYLDKQHGIHVRIARGRGGARRPPPVRRGEEDPHAERAPADALAHVPARPPDRAPHAARSASTASSPTRT